MGGVNIMFGETLDVNAQSFVLTDLVALLRSLADGHQQILHFLVVDFQHGNAHFELFVFVFVIGNPLEDLFTENWNNSFVSSGAQHCISFSSSILSVSQETAMIAFPSICQDFETHLLENVLLVCILLGVAPLS